MSLPLRQSLHTFKAEGCCAAHLCCHKVTGHHGEWEYAPGEPQRARLKAIRT